MCLLQKSALFMLVLRFAIDNTYGNINFSQHIMLIVGEQNYGEGPKDTISKVYLLSLPYVLFFVDPLSAWLQVSNIFSCPYEVMTSQNSCSLCDYKCCVMLHFCVVLPCEHGRKPEKNVLFYKISIMMFLIVILLQL